MTSVKHYFRMLMTAGPVQWSASEVLGFFEDVFPAENWEDWTIKQHRQSCYCRGFIRGVASGQGISVAELLRRECGDEL